MVVVVGDDAVAATGERVVLLVRCGNSMLVQVTVVVVVDVVVEVAVVVVKVAVAVGDVTKLAVAVVGVMVPERCDGAGRDGAGT